MPDQKVKKDNFEICWCRKSNIVGKTGLLDQLITCTGFDNTSEKLFDLADGKQFNASR